jgi:DNA-binding transcriptional LysR family regulator
VHAALSQLQAAFAPPRFDPATTERRFTIVAGAYACAVLVPELVAQMAREAPRAELVIAEAASDILEQLDSRRADFVIGSVDSAPERLTHEILLRENLAWIVRAENPLPLGPISIADLLSIPHVVISRRSVEGQGVSLRASWEDLGAFEAALEKKGLKRRVGVTVPDTYSAMGVIPAIRHGGADPQAAGGPVDPERGDADGRAALSLAPGGPGHAVPHRPGRRPRDRLDAGVAEERGGRDLSLRLLPRWGSCPSAALTD